MLPCSSFCIRSNCPSSACHSQIPTQQGSWERRKVSSFLFQIFLSACCFLMQPWLFVEWPLQSFGPLETHHTARWFSLGVLCHPVGQRGLWRCFYSKVTSLKHPRGSSVLKCHNLTLSNNVFLLEGSVCFFWQVLQTCLKIS